MLSHIGWFLNQGTFHYRGLRDIRIRHIRICNSKRILLGSYFEHILSHVSYEKQDILGNMYHIHHKEIPYNNSNNQPDSALGHLSHASRHRSHLPQQADSHTLYNGTYNSCSKVPNTFKQRILDLFG